MRAASAAPAIALACALFACAPAVVWHGHTPDRAARVQVLQHGRTQYVVVDSTAGSRFDGIAVASLSVSPDSRRVAYAARRGRHWVVVVDDSASGDWDGIGEVMFTADGSDVIYSAHRSGEWFVVRGAAAGPAFDAVQAGSMSVSRTGRLAYAARRGDSIHVVIDGVTGAGYDGVAALRFDDTGERAGYIARRRDAAYVVAHGSVHGPFEAVADFAWLDDGEIAVLARRDGAWYAHMGAVPQGPFTAVGALRTAPRSWAFLARTATGDRVIEPRGGGPVFEAIVPGSLLLHPRTLRTAYIARTPAGMVAVVAGRAGAPAAAMRALTFSADGAHVGYIARQDGLDHLIINGTVRATAPRITDLTIDACGGAAYVSHTHDSGTVHFRGGASRYDLVAEGTFVVSDDGLHWVAVVGTRASRRLDIFLDGSPTGRRFDWNELAAALAVRPRYHITVEAERIIRAWLTAELRLHVPLRPLPPRADVGRGFTAAAGANDIGICRLG